MRVLSGQGHQEAAPGGGEGAAQPAASRQTGDRVDVRAARREGPRVEVAARPHNEGQLHPHHCEL